MLMEVRQNKSKPAIQTGANANSTMFTQPTGFNSAIAKEKEVEKGSTALHGKRVRYAVIRPKIIRLGW